MARAASPASPGLLMYMWMGFLLLSDCRNSSWAITKLARLSSICRGGHGGVQGVPRALRGGSGGPRAPPGVPTGPMTQTMRSRSSRE